MTEVGIRSASTAGERMGTEPAPAWTRKDLLDTDTLSRDEIEIVMERAAYMASIRTRPVGKIPVLKGVTLVTLFYENSTRTRASFELAGKMLGADVINLSASASSVTKGESLVDTVRTIEAVGAHAIALRHNRSGAPYLAAEHTSASIINAGDGTHAHPTQALLDLYTMRSHLGSVAGRKVVIVGDIMHSRVARSNLWLLTAAGASVTLCGPPTLLPRSLAAEVAAHRDIEITDDLDRAVVDADVVMALRIQRERQEGGRIASARAYARRYQVNRERIERARPGALVMHPGPMNEGVEIAPDVARGLQSVVDEQVTAGVAVRMAVLELLTLRRTA